MSRGTEIIAAIAQKPFLSGDNEFATVKPLAVIEDGRLEPVREGDYPNRDLCWWMVRGITPQREVLPGRLIFGHVEEATQFDRNDPDKDKFQMDWASVKLAGNRNLVEVLIAPTSLDPRELVNQSDLLTIDHPPTPMVLVRVGDKVYGPFKTEHKPYGRQFQVTLQRPPSSEQTSVLKAATVSSDPGYLSISGVTLAADAQAVNRSTQQLDVGYQMLLWNRFEVLQDQAEERIRLYSDEEVVRQAAKKILSKKRYRDFLSDWENIRTVYLKPVSTRDEPPAEIFEALDRRLQRQCESVEELIRGVIESDALAERLQAAISEATKRYIDDHTASLEAEIASSIEDQRQEADDLQQQVQQLENELDRRRRQEEANLQMELNEKRAELNARLEEERAAIAREKQEIDARRQQLEKGLNEAASRFQEGRDELVADFLSLSPFLRQLGTLAGAESASASSTRVAEDHADRFRSPAFLEKLDATKGLADETVFFERFVAHVERAGFRFRRKDLLAFHLSAKCDDLTVLGGLSGTGKSSLPVLYAQALNSDLDRYLRVDVSPAWLEPGDVLGRPNLLEQRFQPSPTGLFHHLVWASMELQKVSNDSRIWIICLDEMNLAQPEHYFSGFLQALPHEGSQRSIGVFADSAVRADDPWHAWSRVPLGGNLRFFGTVNYDETTKPLSQRLMDRSNQLRFDVAPLGSAQRGASTAVEPPSGQPVTVESFAAWTRDAPLPTKAAQIIEELQVPLSVLGCPLTPRRYQAISRFVASAKGLCSPEEAFDMQLRQRILSLVTGLFRVEARRALESVRSILSADELAFADSLRMIERIQGDNAHEIDFESFETDG